MHSECPWLCSSLPSLPPASKLTRGPLEYKLICKKGEGTFSEVLKAQCIKNGRLVAIKRMKARFESVEQVNNLREIQALRRLSNHTNVIRLYEVLL
jgi:renal tumor antigen